MKKKTNYKTPKTARPHFSFKVEAEQEGGLLAFLTNHALKERSRTTCKQLLHDRFISVNDEPNTQWDYELRNGDIVTVHPSPLPKLLNHKSIEVLWQDDHLLMLHKKAGIPTVSSGEEKDKTALLLVSEYLKKFNPRAKVFLLNRIDKDSAGFVLMAKTAELQKKITDNWDKYIVRQQFAVSIEGNIADTQGYLAPPVDDNNDKKRKPSKLVQGSNTAGQARYTKLMQTEVGCLLSIDLLMGRNNRLRKQFAEMKRPIIGDWRNGSKRKDLGRVALETTGFSFIHPFTGKRYDFDQPIAKEFRRWLKQDPTNKQKDKI